MVNKSTFWKKAASHYTFFRKIKCDEGYICKVLKTFYQDLRFFPNLGFFLCYKLAAAVYITIAMHETTNKINHTNKKDLAIISILTWRVLPSGSTRSTLLIDKRTVRLNSRNSTHITFTLASDTSKTNYSSDDYGPHYP